MTSWKETSSSCGGWRKQRGNAGKSGGSAINRRAAYGGHKHCGRDSIAALRDQQVADGRILNRIGKPEMEIPVSVRLGGSMTINTFNHPPFNTVNTNPQFDQTGAQVNGLLGQITADYLPRQVQLVLKLYF